MARQTSLSNYIKRVRTESPDAAGPATAPAPARQAVGLAWEEGPIGGQEGAASQSSSAGSLAPVDLSAIDEPAAQPKLKKYPITVFGHKELLITLVREVQIFRIQCCQGLRLL